MILTCTHNLCFEQNKKNIKNFVLKIFNLYNFRKICILYASVYVMRTYTNNRTIGPLISYFSTLPFFALFCYYRCSLIFSVSITTLTLHRKGFTVNALKQCNISRKHVRQINSHKPHFYVVKLGCKGDKHFFFILGPKHKLWVLLRTGQPRWFYLVPTIYVLNTKLDNLHKFA